MTEMSFSAARNAAKELRNFFKAIEKLDEVLAAASVVERKHGELTRQNEALIKECASLEEKKARISASVKAAKEEQEVTFKKLDDDASKRKAALRVDVQKAEALAKAQIEKLTGVSESLKKKTQAHAEQAEKEIAALRARENDVKRSLAALRSQIGV